MVCEGDVQSRKVRGRPGRGFDSISWKPEYLDNPLGDAPGPKVVVETVAATHDVVPVCNSTVAVDKEATSPPVDARHKPQKRCVSHQSKGDWLREPAPDRPGWEKSSCRLCGLVMGLNPIPQHSSPENGFIGSRNERSTKQTESVGVETTNGPQANYGDDEDTIEAWNERAAIREFDGNYERADAEYLASKDLAALDFVSCNRTDSRTG